jgi:hypothetical protein
MTSTTTASDKVAELPTFADFADKPREGWEWEKDDRLEDLIAQLREKESALEALDLRLAKETGRKRSAKMKGDMAWRNNQRMDLNGGGPIRWDAFYGRNAEKFFYHPTDRNTTYHTTTLLQQVAPMPAGDLPGNQGVPAHQLPPQFDYIYRGWDKEQERAEKEAEKLQGKVNDMESRRRDLEREVVVLWFKIALRVVDRDKLPEKPILCRAATPKSTDPKDLERANAITDASQLLATAFLLSDSFVENDMEKALTTVDELIDGRRKRFWDNLSQMDSLSADAEDITTVIGKYKRLTRMLDDVSKSMAEGYRGWQKGDQADDEETKYRSLRRVQDSAVTYSQILLALHELLNQMRVEWGAGINVKGDKYVPVWDVTYVPQPVAPPAQAPPTPADGPVDLMKGVDVAGGTVAGTWKMVNGTLVGGGVLNGPTPCFRFSNSDAIAITSGDYDVNCQFSVMPNSNGFSDVIPILPSLPAHLCFRNNRDGKTSRVFLFAEKGVPAPAFDRPDRFHATRKYTANIAVRNGGNDLRVTLDGKEVLASKNFANKPKGENFEISVSPGATLTVFKYTVERRP